MPRKKPDVPFCEPCHVQPRTMKHYEKAAHTVKVKVTELEKSGYKRLGFGYAFVLKFAPQYLLKDVIYEHNGDPVEGWWAPWWVVAISQRTGYKLAARRRWLEYFAADEGRQKAMEVACRGFGLKVMEYLDDLELTTERDRKPNSEFKGSVDWHAEQGHDPPKSDVDH